MDEGGGLGPAVMRLVRVRVRVEGWYRGLGSGLGVRVGVWGMVARL